MGLAVRISNREQLWRAGTFALALDDCLIYQHDRDIVFYGVNPVTLRALQALRILPVLKSLLALRADQNLQQFLANHDSSVPRFPAFDCQVLDSVPGTLQSAEIGSSAIGDRQVSPAPMISSPLAV